MLAIVSFLAAASAFPYEMHETKLDNGLRVVVVPTGTSGMFALYGVVGAGSRDEVEAGHSGFAHFFEHIMFKGTKKLPADKRVALLGSLGVDESGYTTDDFTVFHLQGPKEALANIVEIEADRYANLDYSEDEFKTESKAVLGEYNKNFSNPDRKAREVLADLAFDKHTYKHTTMGFLKDIENMPNEYKYSRQFFQRFYTPDDVVFYVAGDVDPAAVADLFKAQFASWKGHRATTDVKDEAALTKERRRQVAWDNPTQERLHVAWRIPSGTRDPKTAALAEILSGYLFSDSSALVNELVRKEELVEALGGGGEVHKDAALFPVSARMKQGKSSDVVLAKIQAALDDVAAGHVDAKRFDAVKSNYKYGVLMGLTSADAVAETVANASGPFSDPHAVDLVLNAVSSATPQDLAAFAKQWFGKDQRAIVDLAPSPALGAGRAGAKGGAK